MTHPQWQKAKMYLAEYSVEWANSKMERTNSLSSYIYYFTGSFVFLSINNDP